MEGRCAYGTSCFSSAFEPELNERTEPAAERVQALTSQEVEHMGSTQIISVETFGPRIHRLLKPSSEPYTCCVQAVLSGNALR